MTGKSDLMEVLAGAENGYDLKVPTMIFSPIDHILALDWSFGTGATPPRL
ncbi:hypothetical protein [Xenorhabdus littoralis]|nr:hypothetical protein [Xenorhabdus sp. Reich]